MLARRNAHAEKLLEFAEFAFDGELVFGQRGRWRETLRKRIGRNLDGRVIFEIGCADGESLCEIAAKFPNVGFALEFFLVRFIIR